MGGVGSEVRVNMIQSLENATAQMGRMILDLHAMKQSKLEFLTERKEITPPKKVVRYGLEDLSELKEFFGGSERSNVYSADFEKVSEIAASRFLRDRIPEDNQKNVYDFMVIDIGLDGVQLTYDAAEMTRMISKPKPYAMVSSLLESIQSCKGADADRKQWTQARLRNIVLISGSELWDWVCASPTLPWPIEDLLRHRTLTQARFEQLKTSGFFAKLPAPRNRTAKMGGYMSLDIFKVVRSDKLSSIQTQDESWKSRWSWAAIASSPAIGLDDYIDLRSILTPTHIGKLSANKSKNIWDIFNWSLRFDPTLLWKESVIANEFVTLSAFKITMQTLAEDRLKDQEKLENQEKLRQELSKNKAAAILDIVEWDVRTHETERRQWLLKCLLVNPHLSKAWVQRLQYDLKTRANRERLSQNKGPGVWDIVEEDDGGKELEYDWRELSKNPTVTPELVKKYENRFQFRELSYNTTERLWLIVDAFPNATWDWQALSRNAYLTEEAYRKFSACLDIGHMSQNRGAGVLAVMMAYPQLAWTEELCKNPHLDTVTVLDHPTIEWRRSDLVLSGVLPLFNFDIHLYLESDIDKALSGYRKSMEEIGSKSGAASSSNKPGSNSFIRLLKAVDSSYLMPSATGEASPPENEQGSSKRRDVNRELIDTLERTEEYPKNRDEDGGSSNTDSTGENTIEAPENLSSGFGKMSNTDEDMEVDDGMV